MAPVLLKSVYAQEKIRRKKKITSENLLASKSRARTRWLLFSSIRMGWGKFSFYAPFNVTPEPGQEQGHRELPCHRDPCKGPSWEAKPLQAFSPSQSRSNIVPRRVFKVHKATTQAKT